MRYGLKRETQKFRERTNTGGRSCQRRLHGDEALELGLKVGKSISGRENGMSCFARWAGFCGPERKTGAFPGIGGVRPVE